ncbi:MAG TPA: orotidine-5'-phosphate decarboxylase [Bryobacteraceae bacterium]|nr:orotidine-5'-phosphate decarboxylase [Bryobacteraceae bacterium]
MRIFSDRLVESLQKTGSPCVVGLDPRIDRMPAFIKSGRAEKGARAIICDFHELVLDAVDGLVSAVKPQLAFFERYGTAGIQAFEDTVQAAKQRGLLVIADGKRNDVDSTAEAYAAAYLGKEAFDVDALTVTPYLGRDSMVPFVDACRDHGKGIFVVLKTSNPGSGDYQDQKLESTGRPLYENVAHTIRQFGEGLMGESGYSSAGAVVGATFPEQARRLRALLPNAIILVTGYGAQGATPEGAAACFNPDGLGAIVNSSRGITYSFGSEDVTKAAFLSAVRENTLRMRDEIMRKVSQSALASHPASR